MVEEEVVPSYQSQRSSMRAEESYRHEPRQSMRGQRRAPQMQEEDPSKIVNIHTTAKLQVVLSKPEKFENAVEIADNLNEKRTVVLNLEGTNRDIARRLIDFLSGVAYANGGQLKRVANNTFIITPYNVDISGDLIDELENTGMFFSQN
ncbi:MAG: cell division protein SepF [Clostridia bacterium]|nr:cell division protein SepF [Clostridia bacterium]